MQVYKSVNTQIGNMHIHCSYWALFIKGVSVKFDDKRILPRQGWVE